MSQDDGNVSFVDPYISFRNIHDLLKGSPLIKLELKYRNEKVILSRHPRHGQDWSSANYDRWFTVYRLGCLQANDPESLRLDFILKNHKSSFHQAKDFSCHNKQHNTIGPILLSRTGKYYRLIVSDGKDTVSE